MTHADFAANHNSLKTFPLLTTIFGTLLSVTALAQSATDDPKQRPAPESSSKESIYDDISHGDFRDTTFVRVFRYKPNYFLIGTPDTKIQWSFKTEPIPNSSVYVGFTQKLFWSLFTESVPFKDINYNPSIFYRMKLTERSSLEITAIEHESNGRGDEESRSWNRAGLRYLTYNRMSNGMENHWDLQLWIPIYPSRQNRDLAQYRGVYDLSYTLTGLLGPAYLVSDLTLRIYPGGRSYINPLKGGQELTFKLRGKDEWFFANVVAQIFHGYGENMLNYRERSFGARVGFGI